MAARFVAEGASVADAQRRAYGWLAQQVQAQASLLAYIDVFWGFAMAAALLIPVALVVLRSVEHHGAQIAH